MDEVRNSLDNLMSRFNDSITHSAPKKLSFDRLSMSFTEEESVIGKKKRRACMRYVCLIIFILCCALFSAKEATPGEQ